MSDQTEITDSDLEAIVKQRHDESHYLTDATEKPVGRVFPKGTRMWWVQHESVTCPHQPRCHWFGSIYWYQGRFTLIKDTEMPFLSLQETVERATGASAN